MRAAVCVKHGSPGGIRIREVGKPSVAKDEVLIRIVATTVTSGDVVLRKQSFLRFVLLWPVARLFFGIKNQRKKILGHEFSGIVDAVGEEVFGFSKGDMVFGTTGFKGGAHAEYISRPESRIVATKPENLSFEEAAALPIGGICAWHFLKKGRVQPGDSVLICGASGSIGTSAVQLAKYLGAHVTGVCSTKNLKLVQSLGADRVIDYQKEDLSKIDHQFDVVFDAVGEYQRSKVSQLLAQQGRYISTHTSPVREKKEYLELLKGLAEDGRMKPVIDITYPLQQIREAHDYVESGRKTGNVVINIDTSMVEE